MKSFLVIAPPTAALGFRLAGVPVVDVDPANEEAGRAAITAALTRPDAGVVAIEEKLLPFVPDSLRAKIAREGVPMLLPFAAPELGGGEHAGEDWIAAIIRDAIGYHIKVGGAR